ncbi:hypothetical protein [Ferrimicrobium sp.]|uniref:hypothetical protein n=1 Tax=Ferrimicrobium sp. TaxID=2926050 RepID=UPI002613F98C|nr:hypothetical protein [Ferrimicrobium sp.]
MRRRIRHVVRLLVPLSLSTALPLACGPSGKSSPRLRIRVHHALLRAHRSTQKALSFAISTVGDVVTTNGSQQTQIDPLSLRPAQILSASTPSQRLCPIDPLERLIGNTIYMTISTNERGQATRTGAQWVRSSLAAPSAVLNNPLGR